MVANSLLDNPPTLGLYLGIRMFSDFKKEYTIADKCYHSTVISTFLNNKK